MSGFAMNTNTTELSLNFNQADATAEASNVIAFPSPAPLAEFQKWGCRPRHHQGNAFQ